MTARNCSARTYGQEHHCSRCGYVWDTNDPDPPRCKTSSEVYRDKQRQHCKKLLDKLKSKT